MTIAEVIEKKEGSIQLGTPEPIAGANNQIIGQAKRSPETPEPQHGFVNFTSNTYIVCHTVPKN